MSKKHKRVLAAILQEPVSGNIHWRDVESLLQHLGASIEPGHGARMRVLLNGVEGTLHRPHHSGVCGKHDIRHLREYLTAAGVSMASLDRVDEHS
ncbi:MAG: type II toxin-antitoxin system HicA family toxin [Pseudomonadota bacterium]|nr:MAG: type II toxin-antitoxin system HicA family toxin [Pseudomonadota bacterium]